MYCSIWSDTHDPLDSLHSDLFTVPVFASLHSSISRATASITGEIHDRGAVVAKEALRRQPGFQILDREVEQILLVLRVGEDETVV